MDTHITSVVDRAKLLSCPIRVAIWTLIAELPAYPTTLARTLGVAPATISSHLRVLEDAGLVRHVQQGRYRLFSATAVRWVLVIEDESATGTL